MEVLHQQQPQLATDAGRLLYAECRELLDRFRQIETRLRAPSETVAGTVRLATVYSIGLHELPPYVSRFMKAHPRVKVHVEYSRTDKVCEACADGTVDFGIVAFPSKTIARVLRAHRVSVDTVMEFDNVETIKRSVEVGTGLAILPASTVMREAKGRTLATADFAEGPFTREVGIIHGRRRALSIAAQVFVRLLAEDRQER